MRDQGTRAQPTVYGIRGHVRHTPEEARLLRELAEQLTISMLNIDERDEVIPSHDHDPGDEDRS